METKLINPRRLVVGYRKEEAFPFRMKAYRAVVGRVARGRFRTATEALRRAVEVYARWCRLYDAAIVAMSNPSPAVTEEGQVVTE